MFEDRKKKPKQGQAGPSPQTAGSFGGKGGNDDNDLSKAKFSKGLDKYRQEFLARQKSQSLNKK